MKADTRIDIIVRDVHTGEVLDRWVQKNILTAYGDRQALSHNLGAVVPSMYVTDAAFSPAVYANLTCWTHVNRTQHSSVKQGWTHLNVGDRFFREASYRFQPPALGTARVIKTIYLSNDPHYVYAYSPLTIPFTQTDSQVIDLVYRIETVGDFDTSTDQIPIDMKSRIRGAAWRTDLYGFTSFLIPGKPANSKPKLRSFGFYRHPDQRDQSSMGGAHWGIDVSVPYLTRFSKSFGVNDLVGYLIRGCYITTSSHTSIYDKFWNTSSIVPDDFPHKPVQQVFNHRLTSPSSFQNVDHLAQGSGSVSVNGANWQYQPLCDFYSMDIVKQGETGEARYVFNKRSISSFSGASYNPSSWSLLAISGTAAINRNMTTDETQALYHLERETSEEWSVYPWFYSFTPKGVSFFNFDDNDYKTFSAYTTSGSAYSINFSGIRQVCRIGSTLWVADADRGLYKIVNPLTSPTVTKMTAQSNGIPSDNNCYGVCEGYSGRVWAIFEGGLGFSDNDGVSWTYYNATTSPKFEHFDQVESPWQDPLVDGSCRVHDNWHKCYGLVASKVDSRHVVAIIFEWTNSFVNQGFFFWSPSFTWSRWGTRIIESASAPYQRSLSLRHNGSGYSDDYKIEISNFEKKIVKPNSLICTNQNEWFYKNRWAGWRVSFLWVDPFEPELIGIASSASNGSFRDVRWNLKTLKDSYGKELISSHLDRELNNYDTYTQRCTINSLSVSRFRRVAFRSSPSDFVDFLFQWDTPGVKAIATSDSGNFFRCHNLGLTDLNWGDTPGWTNHQYGDRTSKHRDLEVCEYRYNSSTSQWEMDYHAPVANLDPASAGVAVIRRGFDAESTRFIGRSSLDISDVFTKGASLASGITYCSTFTVDSFTKDHQQTTLVTIGPFAVHVKKDLTFTITPLVDEVWPNPGTWKPGILGKSGSSVTSTSGGSFLADGVDSHRACCVIKEQVSNEQTILTKRVPAKDSNGFFTYPLTGSANDNFAKYLISDQNLSTLEIRFRIARSFTWSPRSYLCFNFSYQRLEHHIKYEVTAEQYLFRIFLEHDSSMTSQWNRHSSWSAQDLDGTNTIKAVCSISENEVFIQLYRVEPSLVETLLYSATQSIPVSNFYTYAPGKVLCLTAYAYLSSSTATPPEASYRIDAITDGTNDLMSNYINGSNVYEYTAELFIDSSKVCESSFPLLRAYLDDYAQAPWDFSLRRANFNKYLFAGIEYSKDHADFGFMGTQKNIQVWNTAFQSADILADYNASLTSDTSTTTTVSPVTHLLVHIPHNDNLEGMESQVCSETLVEFDKGLRVQFSNGQTSPSFKKGDHYTFGVTDGVLKDNAMSVSFQKYMFKKPVDRNWSYAESTALNPGIKANTVPTISTNSYWRPVNVTAGRHSNNSVVNSDFYPGQVSLFHQATGTPSFRSYELLRGDGEFQFKVSTDKIWARVFFHRPSSVGSSGSQLYGNWDGPSILFRFERDGTCRFSVGSSSNVLSTFNYTAGDLFRIVRNGNLISIYRQTTLLHTLDTSVDTTIVSPGEDIQLFTRAEANYSHGALYDMKVRSSKPWPVVELGNAISQLGCYSPNFLVFSEVPDHWVINLGGQPPASVRFVTNRWQSWPTLAHENEVLQPQSAGEVVINAWTGTVYFHPSDVGKTLQINAMLVELR